MADPRARAIRVDPGEKLRLDAVDPRVSGGYDGREDPRYVADLAAALTRLQELQQRLLAEGRQALLCVLQAMDAAGKDGVLRKVVGPLDSRGVHVWSFKAPSSEELAHDYLWRVHQRAPRRGEMAFFNRSHYEDVGVVRVLGLAPEKVWRRRYEHLVAFERMLTDEGTRVVKVFLHISKAEQKERFLERVNDPARRWKFDPRDLEMRARWDDYMEAYGEAIARTSTDVAPWHVVPADRKWYRDLAVANLLVEVLEEMDPQYPAPTWDPAKVRID